MSNNWSKKRSKIKSFAFFLYFVNIKARCKSYSFIFKTMCWMVFKKIIVKKIYILFYKKQIWQA